VGKRSYDQHCTVATALDVVGERWTLLLVRELLTGPKRFKDLLAGLPGIGTNLLAARLKSLAAHGVVRRATLPPPAGTDVYELTELGRSLEPVVLALSRWGARLMAQEPREAADVRPGWAAMALRSLFEHEVDGPRGIYEFRIDGEAFYLRVGEGRVEARQGGADEPDVVISGGAGTFLALTAGRLGPEEALASGKIRLEDEPDGGAMAWCLQTLGKAATPA
jgi:DNA-binding HxlR family transcriptional regulator